MIEPRTPINLIGARDQLETLCVKVGLVRSQMIPATNGFPPEAAEACLWSSDYAQLLLWPCFASDVASIEDAARKGQAWLDEVLVEKEQNARGQPIDGYLVLALPERPSDDAREDVRRLELSAQVCRKHLIWPSELSNAGHEPNRWARVADVTVLGLPDAEEAPGAEPYWPKLDKDAQELWDRLSEQGVALTIGQDEAI
ncbi:MULTISPECIES: hypothetical protein [Aurantimonas]|uniref:hypothetical protein n=1 Tax=Aurantimonas TaxID=182269 RepID=UPI0035130A33